MLYIVCYTSTCDLFTLVTMAEIICIVMATNQPYTYLEPRLERELFLEGIFFLLHQGVTVFSLTFSIAQIFKIPKVSRVSTNVLLLVTLLFSCLSLSHLFGILKTSIFGNIKDVLHRYTQGARNQCSMHFS